MANSVTSDESPATSELRIAKTPLVDITTINAAESLFRAVKDPFAVEQAGRFADLFVFSDIVRYAVPKAVEGTETDRLIPPLLHRLKDLDGKALAATACHLTPEQRHVHPDYLLPAFHEFCQWALANEAVLKAWLMVHQQDWIWNDQYAKRIGTGRHLFNVENLENLTHPRTVAQRLRISLEWLYYAFDIVLRYPLYGELIGKDQYYLSHPIREEQRLPLMNIVGQSCPLHRLPFSIGHLLLPILKHYQWNTTQYAEFLHEARHLLRDRGVINDQLGTIDKEALEEFRDRARVSVRMKKPEKHLGVIGGIICMAGAATTLSAPAALIGGGVSIATEMWDGTLPKAASNVGWLRWTLEWHLTLRSQRRIRKKKT